MGLDTTDQNTASVGSTGSMFGGAAAAAVTSQFSFLGMTGLALTRAATSETLTVAKEKALEAIKKIPVSKELDITMITIDNAKYQNLQLSSLVVAVRPVDQGHKAVAYHTLLLEGSAQPLEPKIVPINGQNIPMDLYSEAVYDRIYDTAVSDTLKQAYAGYNVLPVAAEVVPRTFDWNDQEEVRKLLVNALCAVIQELQVAVGMSGEIDLTKAARDANLQVSVSYNQPDSQSAVGLPIRTDLGMSLSAVALDRGDATTVNNAQRSHQLAQVGGFIDVVWTGKQQVQAGSFMGVQAPPPQVFAPRLVLTKLESLFAMTPGAQLLAMASAISFSENGGWFSYFKPRAMGQSSNRIDRRDVGVLNIEGNVYNEQGANGFGAPIDTKTTTFTDLQLGQFLSLLVSPALLVSLDVSTCSSDTWYNEVFAAAATGNQGAQRALVEAAQSVTGGAFGQFYQTNASPVVEFEEIVLNGYYTDADGIKRDVRDIDYVAMMNAHGRNDPTVGAAWTDTFLRTDQPLVKRLDARKRMLRETLSDVVFTGTSRRVTMSAAFLDALVKGIAKSGIGFKLINQGGQGEFQSQRGVAGFVQQAALPVAASGLFNQGYGVSGTPAAGGMQSFVGQRRW